jgi:uncharacterized surface protein with fasciclin (FAS1) repeats
MSPSFTFRLSKARVALALPLLAVMASPAVARDKKSKKAKEAEAITAPAANDPAPPTPDTAPPPPAASSAPVAGPPSSAGPPAGPVSTELPPSQPRTDGNTITDGVMKSPDQSTLLSAVKAAGLDQALAGPGPLTLFAPSNAGFARLPAATLQTLMKPENKGVLSAILSNHVVAGQVSAADLKAKIKAGGGKATLNTLAGRTLTATMKGTAVILDDGNGNQASVTQADMARSNGVVHVIDGLLLPRAGK